mgnify:FL=1
MVDLLEIIQNVVALLAPFSRLVYALCFVIGVIMVMTGLRAASRRAETGIQAGSYFKPFSQIFIGVLFISLPALLLSLSETFFGTGIQSADMIFAYAPHTLGLFDAGSPGRAMITGIIMIIQFIGIIAVMRGLHLLNRSAQGDGGPKTFGPGVTFLISGIAAVNFPLFFGAVERLITG